jgi:hypothetical protein
MASPPNSPEITNPATKIAKAQWKMRVGKSQTLTLFIQLLSSKPRALQFFLKHEKL